MQGPAAGDRPLTLWTSRELCVQASTHVAPSHTRTHHKAKQTSPKSFQKSLWRKGSFDNGCCLFRWSLLYRRVIQTKTSIPLANTLCAKLCASCSNTGVSPMVRKFQFNPANADAENDEFSWCLKLAGRRWVSKSVRSSALNGRST